MLIGSYEINSQQLDFDRDEKKGGSGKLRAKFGNRQTAVAVNLGTVFNCWRKRCRPPCHSFEKFLNLLLHRCPARDPQIIKRNSFT